MNSDVYMEKIVLQEPEADIPAFLIRRSAVLEMLAYVLLAPKRISCLIECLNDFSFRALQEIGIKGLLHIPEFDVKGESLAIFPQVENVQDTHRADLLQLQFVHGVYRIRSVGGCRHHRRNVER